MDQTDDFQFKPLTDGLGFHRKSETQKKFALESVDLSTLRPASPRKLAELDTTLELISQDLAERGYDTQNTSFTPTLPRKAPAIPKEAAQPLQTKTSANPTVDEILKTLHDKRKLEFGERTTPRNRISTEVGPATFKNTTVEFSAALLDLMLITAANLLCLITLLVVTKVDLFANLFNPNSQNVIFVSLLAMFAAITWIYLVANRAFLGFTAGEWVFDQRLGTPEQLTETSYSLKVAARSLIVIATGFVLIPLVSTLVNRDILGRWMGLELVKKA